MAAFAEIAKKVQANQLKYEEIDESIFSEHLFTKGLSDPDLIIRTSGELRLSNFLLWQIAYTEMFFTNSFWPEFTSNELDDIISDFNKRERRFGGV